MAREEIDAIWGRIRALEKNSLEVARVAAAFEITSTYNFAVAMLVHLGEPKEIVSYRKYIEPRCNSAAEAALSAKSPEEAFKIATQFENDCIDYLKSRK
jgi:hypothetical protein